MNVLTLVSSVVNLLTVEEAGVGYFSLRGGDSSSPCLGQYVSLVNSREELS